MKSKIWNIFFSVLEFRLHSYKEITTTSRSMLSIDSPEKRKDLNANWFASSCVKVLIYYTDRLIYWFWRNHFSYSKPVISTSEHALETKIVVREFGSSKYWGKIAVKQIQGKRLLVRVSGCSRNRGFEKSGFHCTIQSQIWKRKMKV